MFSLLFLERYSEEYILYEKKITTKSNWNKKIPETGNLFNSAAIGGFKMEIITFIQMWRKMVKIFISYWKNVQWFLQPRKILNMQ